MADFSRLGLFGAFKPLLAHEASSFLLAVSAVEHGLRVKFFRDQAEAKISLPLMAREVSDATLFSISNARKTHYFHGSQSDRINRSAALVTKDKLKTKAILHAKNLNTPIGGLVSGSNTKLLSDLHAAGVRRFVVKPTAGSMGKNTHLNQSAEQVIAILKGNPGTDFVLEQHIAGQEHRLFVVGNKVVASFQRVPVEVTGNGSDNIRALCTAIDVSRAQNPFTSARLLDPTEVEAALTFQGKSWAYVPKLNEVVKVHFDGIVSGQNSYPWSMESLSSATLELAVASMQAVSAPSGALDMIVDRSGVPYVLEINLRSMIAALCFPWPTGPWNMNVPNAVIADLFGPTIHPIRDVAAFDFVALRSEIFGSGRKSRGVDASDFMQFA